jgi:hypothetical protein
VLLFGLSTLTPYDRVSTLRVKRRRHIVKAREAKRFGIILGTLGRQGNPAMFQHARRLLSKHGKTCVQFLMAEIQPHKLALVQEIDVSCSYEVEMICKVWSSSYFMNKCRRGSRLRARGCQWIGVQTCRR